ncbi:MAG: MltA domain-containing protein [Proteobacteria bacterium]|nr:MltA domain-containing protein [Pseudomonadota bacterium]
MSFFPNRRDTRRGIPGAARGRGLGSGGWFLGASVLVLLAVLAAAFFSWQREAPVPQPVPVPPPPSDRVLEKVPWDALPPLADDLDAASLLAALDQSLAYLDGLDPGSTLIFGSNTIPASRLADSLRAFARLARENPGNWEPELRQRFEAYRCAGADGTGRMLFTGYYVPVLDGSLSPNPEFPTPLYGRPPDLVTVDLGLFKSDLAGEAIIGRWTGKALVPYPDRRKIESGQCLAGRGLEKAWVKSPVDSFFLQIQGSGRLRLPDGSTVSVLYDGKNGRAYTAIGRVLIREGKVPREEMSMQAIRRYLETHPREAERILNENESYVFFRVSREPVQGCTGSALTPGRSVAVDRRLFPMGALAWIASEKPAIAPDGQITSWQPFSRFVLLQDTGGAIRGPGRLDLFWGSGPYAETAAGHMQHDGEMVLILLKE